MNLILWRHAEAEDRRPGMTDLDRALTPKGKKQAQRIAHWLKERLPADTRIIVSPARRARETADALSRAYTIEPTIDPAASAEMLIEAADWPNGSDTVVIVGHQPTLGQLAALLMCGQALDWSIRKGALWWLRTPPSGNAYPALLDCVTNPGWHSK